MIKFKKLQDPKFQEIQLIGTIIRITDNNHKAFLVESEELLLQYQNNRVIFQISELTIQNVSLRIHNHSTINLSINTIDDLHQIAPLLKGKLYWTNESFKLFAFLIVKILVATIIMRRHCGYRLQNLQSTKGIELLETQYELSKLLMGLIEKENIHYSPYVVTKRAEYLLLLGLNPKEHYTYEEIKKISRLYLKRLHPDVFEGAVTTFKLVNAAQSYLK